MSIQVKREYLKAIRVRYKNASRKQKKVILDEFCMICQYSRKYAIRILNGKIEPRISKPGPKRQYGEEIIFHLVELWRAMGMPCSKKMVVAFHLWVPFYQQEGFSEFIKNKLFAMSASTIDRLLKPYRKASYRGLSTTHGSWVKSRIPIELLSGEIKVPGFVEADTVAHCGGSVQGDFINTLTMTDLYSGWTQNRAMWTKDSKAVLSHIKTVENGLPFSLRGFACDNGSEFLNDSLYIYFWDRVKPIRFVRRRPYKKNDAAHVEQKNFTHVRQLFGYERLDKPEFVSLMNEIYVSFWNPLLNYFTPTMKLITKTRIGGKIKKVYDSPQTPYQRLMKSNAVVSPLKERLQIYMNNVNPFILRKHLDQKINDFFKLVEQYNIVNKRAA